MTPYPEYKDSGVEWIGEIPSHWQLSRLKYISKVNMGQSPKSEDCNTDGIGIPFLQGNANFGKEHPAPTVYCLNPNKVAQFGSLLFSVRAPVGAINVANQKYGIGRGLCEIIPTSNKSSPKYFRYLLEVIRASLESISTGSTYDAVTVHQVENLVSFEFSYSEQTQIANFLDTKTKQIDELIQNKEQKIKLLQEKRTAVINHAVTKGLNPDVEMKDSGVEWIGEIPVGWSLKKLKFATEVLPSNVDKHIHEEEIQVRLCNYTDVYYNEKINKNLTLKKGSCTEAEYQKFSIQKNYVILTKDSEARDDIGIPALVEEDLEDVVCGYHLTMLKPLTIDGNYLYRFIQSSGTRKYFELNSNGVTRFGLGKSSIENLIVPQPSKDEQQQIANFLDIRTQQINDLIGKEQRKIELLKEYRQSLISDAVTGKIDVRDAV